MILDKENLLSEDQAVTATANSAGTIDLGGANKGEGQVKELLVQVTEAFSAAGAGTLTVALETDDNAAFASATTVLTTAAISKTTLAVGYQIPGFGRLPDNLERYIRLVFTVATGPMTAGKITAGLTPSRQTN